MHCPFTIEDTGEIYKTLKINVPKDLFQKGFDKEASQVAQSISIKGFRKGKAPVHMIKQMHGDKIKQDIIYDIINHTLNHAVNDHKLKVVGHPEVEIKDAEDDTLEYNIEAKLSIRPEPKIESYTGLTLDVEVMPKDEKALDLAKEKFLRNFANFEKSESEELTEADVANINFTASEGDKVVIASSKANEILRFNNRNLPEEFYTNLVGAKSGDSFKFTAVATPAQFNAITEEQTLEFSGVVNSVFKLRVPELNEQFIIDNKVADSLEAFEKLLANKVETERDNYLRSRKEEILLENIVNNNKFEIPQALIDESIRGYLVEAGYMKPDQDLTREFLPQAREMFGQIGEKRARIGVVLDQIIAQESFSTSKEVAEEWVASLVNKDGSEKEQAEELAYYRKYYGLESEFEHSVFYINKIRMVQNLIERNTLKVVELDPNKEKTAK